MRVRHPINKNLTLYTGATWKGLPIQEDYCPMIEQYLELIHMTMWNALNENNRISIPRFDIHFKRASLQEAKKVISRFIASLKAQIRADEERKRREGKRVYRCRIRCIWAKERNRSHNPHYHVALLLNKEAYFTLGQLKEVITIQDCPVDRLLESDGKTNMIDRIRKALASALGCSLHDVNGLIHIPKDPVHLIDRNSPRFQTQFNEAFERLSYFAKVDTKHYGDGTHWFGCSRG